MRIEEKVKDAHDEDPVITAARAHDVLDEDDLLEPIRKREEGGLLLTKLLLIRQAEGGLDVVALISQARDEVHFELTAQHPPALFIECSPIHYANVH